MPEEYLDIVDDRGRVIGTAPRSECHGDPALVHRTAHVLVFNSRGELYLQKRAMTKDVAPGKWDTSVGGHLDVGEEPPQAAVREMAEELGVVGPVPEFLYTFRMRTEIESENVFTFRVFWDGPVRPDPVEIAEGRFWHPGSIEDALGGGIFTRSFEKEWACYKEWRGR